MSHKADVNKYIRGVQSGKIIACKLVRLAVERHLSDLKNGAKRGLYFDEAAANHAIDFFDYLHHAEGEWMDKVFILSPWEKFILWNLFGWKRKDGTRRFRTAYIEVPRKAGKSTFAAGVMLYMFIADGEGGAEIYTVATTRDQAKIVFLKALRMVKKSPELQKYVVSLTHNMCIPDANSSFKPLSSDEHSEEGKNPHGVCIDELHKHKTREMYDTMATGMGARAQPLLFVITTAGTDRESICFEVHERAEDALKNIHKNDSLFAFISTVDADDKWDQVATWKKANPNFGTNPKLSFLKDEYTNSRRSPASQNTFLRKYLNVWTQQVDRWIDLDLWNSQGGEVNEGALIGKPCYAALDLSAVSDLTAFCLLFPREEDPEECDVLVRFWCPEARLEARANRYRDYYQAWEREGVLTATPGDAIDYAYVKRTILEDCKRFRVREINVDAKFQGAGLSSELTEALNGKPELIAFASTYKAYAAAMNEFHRRLLKKKIHHGGNPILKWMANNVAVRQDVDGNLRPDKANSQGKIDGIVTIVMALDGQMRVPVKKKSKYETQGLATT